MKLFYYLLKVSIVDWIEDNDLSSFFLILFFLKKVKMIYEEKRYIQNRFVYIWKLSQL